MRYSVDATGVAAVMSDVSSCFDDVVSAVSRALTAAAAAAAALWTDAAKVSKAFDAVMDPRRRSGPGISPYAGDVAERVQRATTAYIAGDDEMATQTDAAAAHADTTMFPVGRWRGVRP